MPAPLYSAQDFTSAAQAGIMPRGLAWPADADAKNTALLLGVGQTFARSSAACGQLLVDAFPATATQLLGEWESSLGLPDPCAGESPTIQQRRAQVLARLTNTGGQSVAYYTAFALALGYVVTIGRYTAATAGHAVAGGPAYGPDWAYAWSVNSALNTVSRARAGLTGAGEPLAVWSNTVLECEFRAIAPAHAILFFKYS